VARIENRAHLIRWVIASRQFADEVPMTLAEILAGEISPELVPVENGEKLQSTEAAIGRYELQDFGLLYTLRFGFRPSKIACMALHAWKDERAGEWPPGFPPTGGARTESVKFGPGLKYSCGVFCLRPVQALGDAQRAEGFGGRFVVAAWRLARAFSWKISSGTFCSARASPRPVGEKRQRGLRLNRSVDGP